MPWLSARASYVQHGDRDPMRGSCGRCRIDEIIEYHDREQRVVANVGHLLGASIVGPGPPDPGEEEGLLVGALGPTPHHGALILHIVTLASS
jgi:hypothetical protein